MSKYSWSCEFCDTYIEADSKNEVTGFADWHSDKHPDDESEELVIWEHET